MRYKSINRKQDENGTQIIATSIMPTVKKRNSDLFVVMVEKTRLDHLAYKFYNNPHYWWIIANSNGITGTMYAKLGSQIRIPQDIGSIIEEYNRINGI
jgi:hypothetical protein